MRPNRGQALVETALVLPVLLTMMLGIFGLGRVFNAQLVLTNASREGARLGALGQTDEVIQQTVYHYLGGAGLGDPATIGIKRGIAPAQIEVKVAYALSTVVDLPGLPNPLVLQSAATMHLEPNP